MKVSILKEDGTEETILNKVNKHAPTDLYFSTEEVKYIKEWLQKEKENGTKTYKSWWDTNSTDTLTIKDYWIPKMPPTSIKASIVATNPTLTKIKEHPMYNKISFTFQEVWEALFKSYGHKLKDAGFNKKNTEHLTWTPVAGILGEPPLLYLSQYNKLSE